MGLYISVFLDRPNEGRLLEHILCPQLCKAWINQSWTDIVIIDPTITLKYQDIINFVERLFPLASEAHCGYTSLHKYVITIKLSVYIDNLNPRQKQTFARQVFII